MDEDKKVEQYEDSLKAEIKALEGLKRINGSAEFEEYFDFQLKTVAQKLIWTFTSGKDGNNVKNWNDFCRVRGEIVARLHPIQEVRSAPVMIKQLEQQLKNYYKSEV